MTQSMKCVGSCNVQNACTQQNQYLLIFFSLNLWTACSKHSTDTVFMWDVAQSKCLRFKSYGLLQCGQLKFQQHWYEDLISCTGNVVKHSCFIMPYPSMPLLCTHAYRTSCCSYFCDVSGNTRQLERPFWSGMQEHTLEVTFT